MFRVYRTHKSLALTLTFQPDRFYEFERKKKNLDKEGRYSIFVTIDFSLPPLSLVLIILLLLDEIELYIYIYIELRIEIRQTSI